MHLLRTDHIPSNMPMTWDFPSDAFDQNQIALFQEQLDFLDSFQHIISSPNEENTIARFGGGWTHYFVAYFERERFVLNFIIKNNTVLSFAGFRFGKPPVPILPEHRAFGRFRDWVYRAFGLDV